MIILPEHRDLSNQELVNIYGPSITQRKKPKYRRTYFFIPSLSREGVNWHETVEVEKKLRVYDGRKIPREFLYQLPSEKSKKKARKAVDKQKFSDRMKFSVKNIVCSKRTKKERLSCLNPVQPVETKTQIS